ncbi:MAG: c-type cytochrome [Thermoleophilia bacterium]|nr:c-type cytochrome [Thermoleophilia bacterium]
MRRLVLVAPAAALAAVALTGCGSQGVVSPTPETVVGKVPKAAPEPVTPAFKLKGDPTAGKKIFQSAGCAGCHTLAAAGSTGTVGPNLDDAKPDYRRVTARVTLGKGAMPSFKGQLSDQQIADVAAFVVKATGGTP